MNDLLFSLNATVPIFLVVALGYFLRQIHFFEGTFLDTVSRVVFNIALPVSLFNSVYTSDISAAFNGPLIGFTVSGIIVAAALGILYVRIRVPDPTKASVVDQCIFRSNAVLLGLPLAQNILGKSAMGPTAVVIAFAIPLYSILAVIVFAWFGAEKGHVSIVNILKNIVRNPLIIGTVAAVPFALIPIPLPVMITSALGSVGGLAMPLGLLMMGGEFQLSSLRGEKEPLIVATLGRCVVIPGLMLTAAALLGFRGANLCALLVLFATPASVSSFIMAKNMGGHADLAAQSVLTTMLLSVLTTTAGIFILHGLRLL